MAVTFGFYNSINGDRKYDAVQLSSIFDGIIRDGVYMYVGQKFAVTVYQDMYVIIGTGRAWFNHSWILNDAEFALEMPAASLLYPRIDAVVIEVNRNSSVRTNSIRVIQGQPSENPQPPTLQQSDNVYQYPIAYVTISAETTSISQSDIENKVGTSDCPYVTAPLESVDIDNLIAQWKSQFNDHVEQWDGAFEQRNEQWNSQLNYWNTTFKAAFDSRLEDIDEYIATCTKEFQDWYNSLQVILDGNVATNLADEILQTQRAAEFYGAKNLLPITYNSETLSNGVTVTVDKSTGRISFSGTSTASAHYYLYRGNSALHLKKGTYILSGFGDTSNTQFSNCEIGLTYGYLRNGQFNSSGTIYTKYPDAKFTLNYDDNIIEIDVNLASGVTYNSSIYFYPMVRLEDGTTAAWEPYAKTNIQLTNEPITADRIVKKNLFKFPDTISRFGASDDISYVIKDDQYVVLNGKNTSVPRGSQIYIAGSEYNNINPLDNYDEIAGKTLILSGYPGGSSGYMVLDLNGKLYYDYGYGTGPVTFPETHPARFGIYIVTYYYQTNTDLTVYPMLRDTNIIDSTWVPYYKYLTNEELSINKVEVDKYLDDVVSKNYLQLTNILNYNHRTIVDFMVVNPAKGTITIDGTISSVYQMSNNYYMYAQVMLESGVYRIGVEGWNSQVYLALYTNNSSRPTYPSTEFCRFYDDAYEYYIDGTKPYWLWITLFDTTYSNVVMKPYIFKVGEYPNNDNEPYLPSPKSISNYIYENKSDGNLIKFPSNYTRGQNDKFPDDPYHGTTVAMYKDGAVYFGTALEQGNWFQWLSDVFVLDPGTYTISSYMYNPNNYPINGKVLALLDAYEYSLIGNDVTVGGLQDVTISQRTCCRLTINIVTSEDTISIPDVSEGKLYIKPYVTRKDSIFPIYTSPMPATTEILDLLKGDVLTNGGPYGSLSSSGQINISINQPYRYYKRLVFDFISYIENQYRFFTKELTVAHIDYLYDMGISPVSNALFSQGYGNDNSYFCINQKGAGWRTDDFNQTFDCTYNKTQLVCITGYKY